MGKIVVRPERSRLIITRRATQSAHLECSCGKLHIVEVREIERSKVSLLFDLPRDALLLRSELLDVSLDGGPRS